MLNFRKIQLTDAPLVKEYYRHSGRTNCEYSFANLYSWDTSNHYRIDIAQEYLLIQMDYHNKRCFLMPQTRSITALHGVLSELALQQKKNTLKLVYLNAKDKNLLESLYPNTFQFTTLRDEDDYLYDAQTFRTYTGKAVHGKRNHYNKFIKLYGAHMRYEEIDETNFQECLQMSLAWERANHTENTTDKYIEEIVITTMLFQRVALGLVGGCIRIDGNIVAFTLAELDSFDTMIIHVEKADIRFEGLYPALSSLFLQHHLEAKLVNREDDLGMDGLRQSKLSYAPLSLEKKYSATLVQNLPAHLPIQLGTMSEYNHYSPIDDNKTNTQESRNIVLVKNPDKIESSIPDELPNNNPQLEDGVTQLKSLWQLTFLDTTEFIDQFFTTLYRPELTYVAYLPNKTIVSMLYSIPYMVAANDSNHDLSINNEHLNVCHSSLFNKPNKNKSITQNSNNELKGAYLYSVATSKLYRGLSLFQTLHHLAANNLTNFGFDLLFTIPAETSLYPFYQKLGYMPTLYTEYLPHTESTTSVNSSLDHDNIETNKHPNILPELWRRYCQIQPQSHQMVKFDYASFALTMLDKTISLTPYGYQIHTDSGTISIESTTYTFDTPIPFTLGSYKNRDLNFFQRETSTSTVATHQDMITPAYTHQSISTATDKKVSGMVKPLKNSANGYGARLDFLLD